MRRLRHNFGRTVTSPAKRREQPLIVKRGSGLSALVILMLSALGWSSLEVTDAAATHISRVGVVSLLGDTFHAEHTGLTAFNQRSYDVEVPEWQIDQDVTEYLVAKLTSANLSAGSVNIEPNRVKDFYRLWPLQQKRRMDSSKFNQLFTLASAQGYDTLVVMIPTFEPSGLYSFVNNTYGFSERTALGRSNRSAWGAFILRVFDVGTRKQLANAAGIPAEKFDNDIEWKSNFESYSAEEKAELKRRIEERLRGQIDAAFSETHLFAAPSP